MGHRMEPDGARESGPIEVEADGEWDGTLLAMLRQVACDH